jgi:hypothetical protein
VDLDAAGACGVTRLPRETRQTGLGEVLLEFTVQGAYVKVAAIDAASGVEVSIVGPRDAPKAELERLALGKLEFVLKRNKPDKSGSGGPGILA